MASQRNDEAKRRCERQGGIPLGQKSRASILICETRVFLAASRKILGRDTRTWPRGTGELADIGSEFSGAKGCGAHADRDDCC